MAKITCTEHRRIALDSNGYLVPAFGKPLVVQGPLAAPDATSRQTSAFGVDTHFARICSDVALHIGFGGTVTAADDYYPAGAEIVCTVRPGQQIAYLAG